jgi:predicted homoserine dehydrogenase-like protein
MKFVSMGPGPYYQFLRPFHLCNIETPLSVAEAVIYGETTSVAKDKVSEVVAIAKRNLKPGETIGGIGSSEVYHRIYTYTEARQIKAIPMGIAPKAKVLRDIPKGSVLTEENVAPDTTRFIYSLRKMQDATTKV